MSISIYTITHVPFTPPADPIYIPLQAGRALQPDYGYLGDDTGDNISNKNPLYSELTGLYWIWKNHADSDYLGLCHYRRYFLNNAGQLMQESEYRSILAKYDIIIAKSQTGPYDYQTIYSRSHNSDNLIQTGHVIKELYPEYYTDFQALIADNHCYVGNLFVTSKAHFCAYCEWLFPLFKTLESRIHVDELDDYHKRVFGFLSEQLLFLWINHNHLSYYEAPFGLSQEKAETIQLKKNLEEYIRNKNIDAACRHLNAVLDKRPDLSLEMSDFNQDLQMSEHIINICRIEQEASLPSLLDFSNDLTILIRHLRILVSILQHLNCNSISKEEIQYLIDCQVSYKALLYILQNFKQFSAAPVELLNQLALLYEDADHHLTALYFLEEALSLQETNQTTLRNIIAVLQNMGEPEMAAEYQQFLAQFTIARRFVIFIGSDIPILEYIARQYCNALRFLGHNVLLFDKKHFENSMESLFLYQKQGLDGIFVFNNSCFQMRLQSGDSLWDLWKTPCYNILVDHPMYYYDTLDAPPAYGIVVCADKYHVDYVNRFYPAVQKALFLPTAGERIGSLADLKSFRDRPVDVLFIGSYKYHDEIAYDAFALQLEKELIAHPDQTFEAAVISCLTESQRQTLTDSEVKIIIQQYRFIDVNTTALFRCKILEILINAGINITVYGNGWNALDLSRHPCFHFMGLVAPETGIQLMAESKIVLNHMAWFKSGASERIFEAMLAGAVSLTDCSEYLLEHFENKKDIMFYSLHHLERLPDIVHTLLLDSSLWESLRTNAYRKAAQYHTWINRVQELLDTDL